jgi:hypothetical protein
MKIVLKRQISGKPIKSRGFTQRFQLCALVASTERVTIFAVSQEPLVKVVECRVLEGYRWHSNLQKPNAPAHRELPNRGLSGSAGGHVLESL